MAKKELPIRQKPFDVFISYRSKDSLWVNKFKQDLQNRGVKVWLDKEQIRPGDRFAQSLEQGLEMSKTMVLVITKESLKSNWVQEEYYRALSLVNEDRLRLIPILLEKVASLPGFLAGREYIDFSDDSRYELNVDRLVWPGITGKYVEAIWVHPEARSHHYAGETSKLYNLVDELGLSSINLDLAGAWEQLNSGEFRTTLRSRHIVFVNMFHEHPVGSKQQYFPVSAYVDFIFQVRNLTRGTPDEVVFILHHKSGALEAAQEIDSADKQRLSHYFTIHDDDQSMAARLRLVWNSVQRLLLETEIDLRSENTQPNIVLPIGGAQLYAVHSDSACMKTLKLQFRSNGFLKEADVKLYFEETNLVVQFPGKRTAASGLGSIGSGKFFSVIGNEDKYIFVPTGYNNVWLDTKCEIQSKFVGRTELSGTGFLDISIEFLKPSA